MWRLPLDGKRTTIPKFLGLSQGLPWGSSVLTMLAVIFFPQDLILAALLTGWRFDPQTNQLEIIWDDGSTPSYFLLSDPPRIVIDLPNTELGAVSALQNYEGSVRQIRASQFSPDVTRMVLELAPDLILSPQQIQLTSSSENRWILQPRIPRSSTSPENLGILPPENSSTTQSPRVQVPPLNPSTSSTSVPQNSTGNIPVIDFGEPLINITQSPPFVPSKPLPPLMPHH